jgi:DNA-binding XRE family transcriptional regulator
MGEPVDIGNRLRVYRKEACLSQRDLGELLGYRGEGGVSRHERSSSLPTLMMALSYQVIFCVEIHKLFGGLHECVTQSVEARIAEFEENLRHRNGKSIRAAETARKLEWLRLRRLQSKYRR